jgi:hypothetical protein
MELNSGTILIKNTFFKKINGRCFFGETCNSADNPWNTLIKFNLKKPILDATLTTVVQTDTVTFDNV